MSRFPDIFFLSKWPIGIKRVETVFIRDGDGYHSGKSVFTAEPVKVFDPYLKVESGIQNFLLPADKRGFLLLGKIPEQGVPDDCFRRCGLPKPAAGTIQAGIMFTSTSRTGNRRRGRAFFLRSEKKFHRLFGEKKLKIKTGKVFWFMRTAKFIEPDEIIIGKIMGGQKRGGLSIKGRMKDEMRVNFVEGGLEFLFGFKNRFFRFFPIRFLIRLLRGRRRIFYNITCNIMYDIFVIPP
ncbi:MAG: hypothetical protein LBL44_12245 [Treponema sp.]|nr:hypothetical protein [Treponema sp.]